MRYILIVAAMAATLVSIANRERTPQGTVETATIAPAAGQPAPTGTDATTQTVEVEGSRPEAEGAGITDPEPASANTTAGTTAPTGTARPKPPSRP